MLTPAFVKSSAAHYTPRSDAPSRLTKPGANYTTPRRGLRTPMARWGGAGGRLQFLKQFSRYLIRYATWIPPLIWFNTYVAEVTFIRGPSMYPFLNPHYNESLRKDLCLVWKLYAHENLARGMVVTFRCVLAANSHLGSLAHYSSPAGRM